MTTVRRCNLRLSDVHATAETVGSEFKKLADRFGMECVAELLTPVVQTLEWLEAYVESYQQLQTTVSELEMENDTFEYEREQRALLGNKNESLEGTIRELQKENRCLLMEMDDIYFRNTELSALLEKTSHPAKHTTIISNSLREETLSPTLCPPSPPPHSPNRVVHLSQIYPSPARSSHSPNFTPSPSPTLPTSLLRSCPATDSTPTSTPAPPHIHQSPPTPDPQRHPSLHTLPVSPLPSPSLHHYLPNSHPQTPPSTRAHRVIQLVGRSSSLSDVAKVRVQTGQLYNHEEDMFERSRVTRRLSKVESELEMTVQQLEDLQRSRERLMDENKQLKTQVEKLQAEVSLESIVSSRKDQPTEEAPRYYKKDVVQVLTERNRLKEQLHSLQEELEQFRDALRSTATGTRSRRRKSAVNGVSDIHRRGPRKLNSVRNILTESICLDSYPDFQPFNNGSPQKTHS